jgi:shikimate dehydrogenase
MTLTGNAKIAGVMGWPIAHSRSPRLHGFWLDSLDIDGAYLPLAVRPEDLPTALAALGPLGFQGVNLTLPHKEAALDICDRVDEIARRIGAVNTIIRDPGGGLRGTNTDAFGFIENIHAGAAWTPSDGPAMVIGAGGAARAVVAALIDAGVPEIRLANRTAARAEALARDLEGPVSVVDLADAESALADALLLVNTTSLGMAGQPPLDLALDRLPETAVVNDIVYVPLETDLLARARARGNPVVDGLGMLLHQARPGFEAWFGTRPEVTPELREFVMEDLNP